MPASVSYAGKGFTLDFLHWRNFLFFAVRVLSAVFMAEK
jgi:hypothetical protein